MQKREVRTEQIEGVITEALEKYREEYAPLSLSVAPGDFLEEAEEELLGAINLAVFQVLKIRHIRENWLRRV